MRNKGFHIHLHLDHPERENPWLGEPEPDPAAAPFLDDADRLLNACWAPLAAAERRGADGGLEGFTDLYGRCGFDAAPATLERLSRRAPEAYACLAAAAPANALATAYPALLLNTAAADDRRAAVRWGLADFRRRFAAEPAGFVPPAGCADEATLELLAREGLRFVLLPASAARRVREADGTWRETAPETLDCSRPYRWRAESDPSLSVAVFFSPEAPDPARLLARAADPEAAGERLAAKLVDSLRVNDAAELAHAAFDASWFGARLARGERALARALAVLEREAPADAQTFAAFLDRVGAPQDCVVRPVPRPETGAPDAPSDWKAPFAAALASLSAALAAEARAARAPLVRDPDAAVDLAGRLAFDAGEPAQQAYLDAVCRRHPVPEEAVTLLRLAELERWRLKSLALWALDDAGPAGPDALQALRCAARALDLAALVFGKARAAAFEDSFVAGLAAAPCRGTPFTNAAAAYRRLAAPERSGAERAAAHAALGDHLAGEGGPAPASAADWDLSVRPVLRRARREGRAWGALSLGAVRADNRRAFESFDGTAVVLTRPSGEPEVRLKGGTPDAGLAARLEEAFLSGSQDALAAALDAAFGPRAFALDALFPAARRPAARALLERGAPERRARVEGFARLTRLGREPGPAEWAAALKTLAGEPPADALPGAPAARAAAARAALRFARAPGADTLGDLLGLLEAAREGGLHLPLWELRPAAWRGLARAPAGSDARRLAELLGLPHGGDHAHP